MKTKIKRRCACGCKQITNPKRRYINGHNSNLRIGNKNPMYGKHHTKRTKRKMSLAAEGNKRALGHKLSEEHKLKLFLKNIKYDPNYKYCDEWKDRKYRKELRKDYCENVDCKGKYKRLGNHHINLNPKDCRPFNTMTMCCPCHAILHHRLGKDTTHKDYLTVIRKDRITYIHKATRQMITTIKRREKN